MIKYHAEVLDEIRAIESPAIRNFILDVLGNGSFLKKKMHIKGNRFKAILRVGHVIYFEQIGSDVVVTGLK